MSVIIDIAPDGKFSVKAKEEAFGTLVLGTELMLPDVAQAIAHYYRIQEHNPRRCPVCAKRKENGAHT